MDYQRPHPREISDASRMQHGRQPEAFDYLRSRNRSSVEQRYPTSSFEPGSAREYYEQGVRGPQEVPSHHFSERERQLAYNRQQLDMNAPVLARNKAINDANRLKMAKKQDEIEHVQQKINTIADFREKARTEKEMEIRSLENEQVRVQNSSLPNRRAIVDELSRKIEYLQHVGDHNVDGQRNSTQRELHQLYKRKEALNGELKRLQQDYNVSSYALRVSEERRDYYMRTIQQLEIPR